MKRTLEKLNLAIAISGGGTTMRSVLLACGCDNMLRRVNPVLIVSNNAGAGGLDKARICGVADKDRIVLSRSEYPEDQSFGEALLHECVQRSMDVLVLCGFLRTVPGFVTDVIESYNQHPGPLDPGHLHFGGQGMHGKAVHQAVLEFAKRIQRPFCTEASVHVLTAEVDGGPLVGIHPVRLYENDTAGILSDRVLPHEHKLVINVLYRRSEFGKLRPIKRENRLVQRNERQAWLAAIETAKQAYPNG
ncbi:MAG: hypothetical protein HYW51_00315 [Candidatus Doudnabacteria bacterium]|nr:hypothetical protein [Candidatus Doudnabacteria bacterium]